MPMPTDIGVIDLMIAPPFREAKRTYQFLRQNLRDRESLEDFEFPAQYMFKNVPHPEPGGDPVAFLVDQMDRFGIEKGMLGVGFDERAASRVPRSGGRFACRGAATTWSFFQPPPVARSASSRWR